MAIGSPDTSNDRRLNRSIALLIVLVMVVYLILGWTIDQHRSPITYYVSQWMITYRAGFIRRGILGQTIWDVSHLLHIRPVEVIKTFHYALAATLSAVLGYQCYKNRQWLGIAGIAILIVNPYLSKYIWLETGSIDLFFVLLPFFNLWLTKFATPRYVWYSTLFFATVGVYVSLSHEAFVLLCLPVNVFISWRALGSDKVSGLCKIYGAPLLACAVASFYHGTGQQALIIERAWRQSGVAVPNQSAIFYMGFSFMRELRFVAAVLSVPTLFVWVFATAICFLPLWWLARTITRTADPEQKASNRLLYWGFLWFPILCTIPMYIIGSDWDRWPSVPVITGAICILMVAEKEGLNLHKPKLGLLAAGLILISLFVRPVPPNVKIDQVFTGPANMGGNLVMYGRV